MTVLLLGFFIGLVMGLTGAGGSILAVPLLMFFTGQSLPAVASAALVTVATAAALGAWLAWRQSQVRYRAAGLMALVGLGTAPLGLAAANAAPASGLSLAFAMLLGFVALHYWRQGLSEARPSEAPVFSSLSDDGKICQINDITGRLIWTGPCALCVALTGAMTGFLSGLLGVGGGFFIVPALNRATPLHMTSATGTSLMAIALTSGGVVLVSVLSGHAPLWSLVLPLMTGALLGMSIARRFVRELPVAALRLGFAALLSVVALLMVWRSVV